MTLNQDRWLVRWFFWSVGILDEFTEDYREGRMRRDGTNLCAFCQITFLWTPLVLLLNLAVYAAVFSALTVAPIYFFGWGGYGSAILAIALIVLLIVGIGFVRAWLDDRRAKERKPLRDEPSAVNLAWQWMVAKKRNVCPLITFTKEA